MAKQRRSSLREGAGMSRMPVHPSWGLLTIDDTKATKTDRKPQGQGERRVRRRGIFAAKNGPMLGFVMVMTARSGSDKRREALAKLFQDPNRERGDACGWDAQGSPAAVFGVAGYHVREFHREDSEDGALLL